MSSIRKFVAGLCASVALCGPALSQDLVVAAVSGPRGVDGDVWVPGSIESVINVYESLVKLARKRNPDGQWVVDASRVEPHLAESWTVSPDGKVYTFTLRKGVKSYYGNELTADDVVFGFQKSAMQKRTGRFISTAARIADVTAVSRYEVRYTLSEPNNLFLRALTHYTPMIIDSVEAKKHATAEDPFATKWLGSNTAGFGAYHLAQNRAGEGAIFVANPNYFGGKLAIQRVMYREVPSGAARMSLLQGGQVQIAEELSHSQLKALESDSKIKIGRHSGTGSATVRMNPRIKPFDDIRIRKAIIYATDVDAINRAVFEGLGERARSIVPPAVPGHVAAYTYQHDPEQAKKLLAEAGYPNGIDVTLEYTSTFWWEEPLVLQLRTQLEKAGIRVNPTKLPNTVFAARGAIGKRDLGFATHLTNVFVLDPGYALFLSAHSRGSSNRNDYHTPELDKLIETVIVERDPQKAMAAAAEAQRIHASDATFVDTVYPGTYVAMNRCVEGWTWYPTNRIIWRDLSCAR